MLVETHLPDRCPICGAPPASFVLEANCAWYACRCQLRYESERTIVVHGCPKAHEQIVELTKKYRKLIKRAAKGAKNGR